MNETVKAFGEQMINERISGYGFGENANALILAAGYHTLDVMKRVKPSASIGTRSLQQLVLFGLHPAKALVHGFAIKNPYREENDHGLSDPLQVALLFARFVNKKDGLLMIELRKQLLDDFSARKGNVAAREEARKAGKPFAEWPTYKSPLPLEFWGTTNQGAMAYFSDRMFHRTWVPPDPTQYGMPLVDYMPVLDSAFLAPWFDDDQLVALVKQHGTGSNVETFAQIAEAAHKNWEHELGTAAIKQAYRYALEDTGRRTRYYEIAQYIRLCPARGVKGLFDRLSGARAALTLVRADTSTEHYVKGLRALAQLAPETRREILQRLGRAPTVDELKSIRSAGLLDVLDDMPWEVLGPLVEQRESALRALCLPFVDRAHPEVISRYMNDHEKRQKLLVELNSEKGISAPYVVGNTAITEWERVFTRVHATYARSQQIRDDLLFLTGDPAVSFLALLGPFKASSPQIDHILSTHTNYPKIKKVLEGYVPPDIYTSGAW